MIKGRHYATGESISVTVEEGEITNIEETIEQESPFYIAPGLVDIQINGYKGYDFNTLPIPDGLVEHMTSALWAEGVTSYYPTIITNSDEAIENAVKTIAVSCDQNPIINHCIAGIHIEGPFISPEDGPRGAHGKEFVKAPDWDLFQRWQEAAKGRIRIITISPEWPNAVGFIEKCVESGVVVAIGHTAATPGQIREAVAAGATMSTHLGNAAHLMLPRHPNYIWEQLAQDDLWASLIADGFHLPESFLKVAMKVKESRAMLVSDAVYLSGLAPGQYETHIGGHVVLTAEGKLHTKDNSNILAGSALMLKEGIGHLYKSGITTLHEAWEMASTRPSHFMKLPTDRGLNRKAPADLVIFSWDENQVNIVQTYKAGKLVYSKQ
ncbi:N-acetylglucosamine-6-phosphate deacetylase [Bacillus sp. FJAT-49711]|uniref:N-acetylglucosamine-6-phosphate deacetylase n=1 Tax=Bacillus sp. FJAT-49711 TaxID=2833585 RepID=UPI001BC8F487|nr:amidohydrolase family protein [Bacillus sp. FJAT-49711]MBS4219153.1 N-acetylglucosamine-6-phosphate deacetylase [Bacillus sp. FJAT-49711]